MYTGTKIKSYAEITELFTLFEARYNYNYKYDGESHDFWETVFVLDGNVGVTAGSNVYMLRKGQAVFHKPMEFHKIWAEKGTNPRIAVFTYSASEMPETDFGVYELTDENMREVKSLLGKSKDVFEMNQILVTSVIKGKEIEASIFAGRLRQLILSVLTNSVSQNIVYKKISAENYQRILSVLEDNIEKKLSALDIAKQCNMSLPAIKKTFSKYAGVGVMHYFNEMKIKRAELLLKNGLSVKEAAFSVGFTDQNYFSTIYKRIRGHAPTKKQMGP